jgi:hypothetical protein
VLKMHDVIYTIMFCNLSLFNLDKSEMNLIRYLQI